MPPANTKTKRENNPANHAKPVSIKFRLVRHHATHLAALVHTVLLEHPAASAVVLWEHHMPLEQQLANLAEWVTTRVIWLIWEVLVVPQVLPAPSATVIAIMMETVQEH